MIDEEEEEKKRKRIKKQQFDKAIAKDDQEGEEVHSEPTEPEDKKTDFREKPKTNRPRRPEVKHTIRDELWCLLSLWRQSSVPESLIVRWRRFRVGHIITGAVVWPE